MDTKNLHVKLVLTRCSILYSADDGGGAVGYG